MIIFNVDFWDKRFIDLVQVSLLGYNVVTGSKNLPGSSDRRPLDRRLVTKVLRRAKVLPIIEKCKTKTGIFDSELLIRAQRQGLKILELPVEIIEKRPNRFGIKRVLETPKDMLKLYLALSRK